VTIKDATTPIDTKASKSRRRFVMRASPIHLSQHDVEVTDDIGNHVAETQGFVVQGSCPVTWAPKSEMFRADPLVKLLEGGRGAFGQGIPFSIRHAGRVIEQLLFDRIGEDQAPIEQLMTAERSGFVAIDPIRTLLGVEFGDSSLSILLDGFTRGHSVRAHWFSPSPACFQMLLSVPSGTSSDILPGTVTLPGFDGCLT
jgi:hypothetical protein